MAHITKEFEILICSDADGNIELSSLGKMYLNIYQCDTVLQSISGLTPQQFKSNVNVVFGEYDLSFYLCGVTQTARITALQNYIENLVNLDGFSGTYYIKLKSGNNYAMSNASVRVLGVTGVNVGGFYLYTNGVRISNNTYLGLKLLWTSVQEWMGFSNIDNGIISGDMYELTMTLNSNFTSVSMSMRKIENPANEFITWLNGTNTYYKDPYGNGGTSGVGGGTGNFDGSSDNIDFPSLPSLSAVATGFITLYNPTLTELQALANYMWSNAFDLDTFKKLFADPMDVILGLSIVPVNVPSSSSQNVTIGNISTGVSMTLANTQYVEVDCGSINVNEYWGAYLDYEPYTKADIYLPYCGTHPLSVDEIMGKNVHVKYHVDILSGACTAFVKCGNSVLYEFIGQCSASIPINGNDWTNVINGVLSIAGSVGTMVATGGATAPMAIGAIASTAVNSFKPSVEKSGAISGVGGMLAIQKPYIILSRPKQAVPSQQNVYMGYPSFITSKLGDLQGYTEVDSIRLENVPCTESEYNELLSLLKSGVIL